MTPFGSDEQNFSVDQPAEGMLLAEALAGGRVPAEAAFQYALEIGDALDRWHVRGLVHGSLSPHSIAITPPGIRILRSGSADPRAAAYRAPEQVRGEEPDSRSDIFAYGAILYELVCGVRAFSGEGAALEQALLKGTPAPIPLAAPLREAVGAVIASCLEKERVARRQRIRNAVIELKLNGRAFRRAAQLAHAAVTAPPPRGAVIEFPQAALPPAAPLALEPPPPPAARFLVAPTEQPRVAVREPWWQRGLSGGTPAANGAAGESSPNLYGWRFWLIAAGILALFVVTTMGAMGYLRHKPGGPALKFSVAPPEHTTYPGAFAVSPDGRRLVFSASGADGKRMLWLRPFDAQGSSPVPGTEGASNPFWSPDGQSIGFFAGKLLKRTSTSGGETQPICPADAETGGGTWNREGAILFVPRRGDGLYLVRANGGKPERILNLNEREPEISFLWPEFLPDGRHFLFFVLTNREGSTGVYTGAIDSPDYSLLFPSETNAVYASLPGDSLRREGYLLYIRGTTLMRHRFDAQRLVLTGKPAVVAEDVAPVRSQSLAPISASSNATLAYQTLGKPTRQMVWLDRSGSAVKTIQPAGDWGPPRISPDGTRAVAGKRNADAQAADLWLIESDGSVNRLTSTEAHEGAPVWSPDGSRVAFFMASQGAATFNLYVLPVAGGKAEMLLQNPFPKYPTDWSADGRFLFFNSSTESTKVDLWALALAGPKSSGPVVETIHAEGFGALSPDGKWLAYQTDESGRNEIHVRTFRGISSESQHQWRVSSGGGALPRWRGDGKELYYLTAAGSFMATAVHPNGAEFEFDPPQMLFRASIIPKTWNLFDVARDGERFLFNLPLEWPVSAPITVMTNWTETVRD